MWLHEYEDPTFERQLENIFEEIRPLYQQLHAYVRHSLRKKFGDELIKEDGLLPMHILGSFFFNKVNELKFEFLSFFPWILKKLGNMWAQSWDSIFKYTAPYPNKKSTDVTEEMVKQGYTPKKMFELGEKFYKSLNMTALPQ